MTSRIWAIGAAVTLALTTAAIPADASAATSMSWEHTWTSHAAVWNDGSDALTVKIKTSGPVEKVIIDDLYGGTEGLHAGEQVGRIRLYDDGTHGDAKAGDSMFTRSGISVIAPWDYAKCIWVELHAASGAIEQSDWSAFQVLALDRKHEVALNSLDADMRVSGRIANLRVGTDVYQPKVDRWQRKAIDLKTVTKRFYQRFYQH